jgi:hypothetical protein
LFEGANDPSSFGGGVLKGFSSKHEDAEVNVAAVALVPA